MNNKFIYIFLFFISFTLIFYSCKNISDCKPDSSLNFNEDSAYLYIAMQVKFGSRVPNSAAHDSCVILLSDKLKSFGADVVLQNADLERFDGIILHSTNIIGTFYPDKKRRILLFAHFDSRYYSDMEAEPEDQLNPVLGANDGASGVGVLLEIARQISEREPDVGVDIVFFDAEDQGQPIYMDIFDEKAWCLGAQYWAENAKKDKYKALCGIGLDMVGTPNAIFAQDDNSRYFNNFLMKRFWKLADTLGYENYFPKKFANSILHDHVFVNQIAGVPSVMIMDLRTDEEIPYFNNWHTHNDKLENIDKKSLKAIGQTLLNFVYCEKQ